MQSILLVFVIRLWAEVATKLNWIAFASTKLLLYLLASTGSNGIDNNSGQEFTKVSFGPVSSDVVFQ